MNKDELIEKLDLNRDKIKEILKQEFDYVYAETQKYYKTSSLPLCLVNPKKELTEKNAYIITNLLNSSIRLNTITGTIIKFSNYEVDKSYTINLTGTYTIKFEILYYKKDDSYLSHEELTNEYKNSLRFHIVLTYNPKLDYVNKAFIKSAYWKDLDGLYKNVLITKGTPSVSNLLPIEDFDLNYDLETCTELDHLEFVNKFNHLIGCSIIDTTA